MSSPRSGNSTILRLFLLCDKNSRGFINSLTVLVGTFFLSFDLDVVLVSKSIQVLPLGHKLLVQLFNQVTKLVGQDKTQQSVHAV